MRDWVWRDWRPTFVLALEPWATHGRVAGCRSLLMKANDWGAVGQRMEADGGLGGLASVVTGALEGGCLVVGRGSRGSLHRPVDVTFFGEDDSSL
jgi:hypothetical protein